MKSIYVKRVDWYIVAAHPTAFPMLKIEKKAFPNESKL
jgi:hypothetical protein